MENDEVLGAQHFIAATEQLRVHSDAGITHYSRPKKLTAPPDIPHLTLSLPDLWLLCSRSRTNEVSTVV